MACRSLDTEPSVAEVDLVQIGLEDLILGVMLFHLPRGRLFTKLSRETEIAAVDDVGMHVPDELLGNGAGPPAPLAEQLPFDCRSDADEVDTIVLVKALVFHGDERLRQISRERSDRDGRSELPADLPYQRAVAGENE